MFAAIVTILWIVFLFNLLGLIGALFLGKFLFASNIVFLRVLMNPAGTAKAVGKGAGKIIRLAGWTAASGALLFLIYF